MQEHRGRLELSPTSIRRYAHHPHDLLRLIDHSVELALPLAGRTRHALRRALHHDIGPQHISASWSEPLRRWFELEHGLAARLRALDELDAINLWLPEWREIAGLTTGSYYHRYTVDEHILRALQRLDNLPADGIEDDPASLWEKCNCRPLVQLAILFHDIAKGRPGNHSLEGASIARDALARIGMGEYADDAAKLVRIHLLMEQTAFRRDFSDPTVIGSFVSDVGSERCLTALYLLTICDLSAVRARVWTEWKGRLLAELYVAARDVLRHGLDIRRSSVAQEVERVTPYLGELDNGRDRAEEFIRALEADYRRSVPAEEIARHLEAVESLQRGDADDQWLIDSQPGFVTITLIDRDRPGLLADVTGLLTAQGIGIREARIFTRQDGIIIDRFRCEDIEPSRISLKERLGQIPDLWHELKADRLNVNDLFARLQRRSRRDRPRIGLLDAEIMVRPVPDGAVIDVSGADSIGLLYRLCSTLADEGFGIRSARVTGRLDGIMDSFLVHDPERRLVAGQQQQQLITRLHDAASATSKSTP